MADWLAKVWLLKRNLSMMFHPYHVSFRTGRSGAGRTKKSGMNWVVTLYLIQIKQSQCPKFASLHYNC